MKFLSHDTSSLAFEVLRGAAVLFPTDTLPALAAAPNYVSKLWEIKQRPLSKPLILMAAESEVLLELVDLPAVDDAKLMAERFWPGPLTMVVPSSDKKTELLNPGKFSIGMRVPKCPLAIEFLAKTGPIATTSANISGHKSALSLEDALDYFPNLPFLGPLPWPVPSGLASTVISWQSEGCWQILRSGSVQPESFPY